MSKKGWKERGGHGRIRTYNLLIWNQPLYQLELHTLKHSRRQRNCFWLCSCSALGLLDALSPHLNSSERAIRGRPSLKNTMHFLVENIGNGARSYCPPTLTDSKLQSFFHSDGSNQVNFKGGVISRHDHFDSIGKFD